MRLIPVILILASANGSAIAQNFLQTNPATLLEFPRIPSNRVLKPLPGSTPEKFNFTHFTGRWDGMPIGFYRMRVGPLDLQLSVEDLTDWPVVVNGNYSLNLIWRWDRNVRAHMAWFPQRMFLDNLDNSSWQSYLSTIPRRTHHNTLILINDDSKTNPAMIRVLNSRTRVLQYLEISEKTGLVTQAYVQVFVENSGGVLLMSIEGRVENITNAMPSFANLLMRFGPFDPNPSTSVQ